MISNGQHHSEAYNTLSSDSGISTQVEDVPSSPRPVQVITTNEDTHTFTLNDAALASILLRDDIADKKVTVISVAGAFRKGKSFLLNFFLRYLQSNQKDKWLGDDKTQLDGFKWRGGSKRETTGIHLWSEPFILKLPSGEEVAVILMDTQGAFDSESTVKDWATIFALSTMISSVQICNLSQNIQEDDLQHLQLFTEFGRLALQSSDSKPFQTLTFLVRDWSFPYEADYGFGGGAIILEHRLKVSDKQHQELQQLRRHIRLCFSDINCFLMPHPGKQVATSAEFRGQLAEIDSEFKKHLRGLVSKLMSPDGLVLKEVNGEKVTCRHLLEYFRAYIKIFQGGDLPEPKSIFGATAEANNLVALAVAKAEYVRGMEEVCGGDTPYMTPRQLDKYHESHEESAVRKFKGTRKMGGEDYSQQFLEKLHSEILESYVNFVKVNNGKNVFLSRTAQVVIGTVATVATVAAAAVATAATAATAAVVATVAGAASAIFHFIF